MACHVVGAKPLSEPMLEYCWPLGTNFSELLIEIHSFSSKKFISKCRLQNGGHFVSNSVSVSEYVKRILKPCTKSPRNMHTVCALPCSLVTFPHIRAYSRFALNQWETALLCNDVSHWLGTNLESALHIPWVTSEEKSVPVPWVDLPCKSTKIDDMTKTSQSQRSSWVWVHPMREGVTM